MHLTLILDNLVWPREAKFEQTLDLAGGARLLAACEQFQPAGEGLTGLLCRSFGVAKQVDWPVAPLLASLDGLDTAHGYWLCADLAHLNPDRSTLIFDLGALDFTPEEQSALFETLNGHFSEDQLSFVTINDRGASPRGYLRLPHAIAASTRPPEETRGQSVFNFMPQGRDARLLRKWMNEIQMILYDHSVNLEREARGMKAINSIWLWGGGARSTPARASVDRVFGSHPLMEGLAQAGNIPREKTVTWEQLNARSNLARALVFPPTPPLLLAASQEAWKALDSSLLTPLALAWGAGRLSGLDVAVGGVFDSEIGWKFASATRKSGPKAILDRLLRGRPNFAKETERLRRG